MGKFYGTIGYVETVEKTPGVWVNDSIVERSYSGDLTRNFSKQEPSNDVNDNINIANSVSIIADPYALEHVFAIKYVKIHFPRLGGIWKVTNVEVSYPRLILTVGGVYNGPTSDSSK